MSKCHYEICIFLTFASISHPLWYLSHDIQDIDWKANLSSCPDVCFSFPTAPSSQVQSPFKVLTTYWKRFSEEFCWLYYWWLSISWNAGQWSHDPWLLSLTKHGNKWGVAGRLDVQAEMEIGGWEMGDGRSQQKWLLFTLAAGLPSLDRPDRTGPPFWAPSILIFTFVLIFNLLYCLLMLEQEESI